jgi:hypothetical protein
MLIARRKMPAQLEQILLRGHQLLMNRVYSKGRQLVVPPARSFVKRGVVPSWQGPRLAPLPASGKSKKKMARNSLPERRA